MNGKRKDTRKDTRKDATLIYEDRRAPKAVTALEDAVNRFALVGHPHNGAPGIPPLPNPSGERWIRYDTVWSPDHKEYLVVTPWGKAKRLGGGDIGYELSAYTLYDLVQPNDGIDPLPEAHAPKAGDVYLDSVTGMATVTVNGDDDHPPVAVHHLRLDLENGRTRGYKLMGQIGESLLQAGVPVLPARLWRQDSMEYPWDEKETAFSAASVSNGEVTTSVVGYAMDKQVREMIYLHQVGWKTACRSVWASLNSSNGKLVHVYAPGSNNDAAFGTHNYHTYANVVDEDMGIYRMLAVDCRAFEPEVDERAYLLVRRGEEEENVDRLFAGRLNAVLPIPIRPEWGRVLRQEGSRAKLVRPIQAGGDVAQAYALEPQEAWYEVVEQLLRSGAISI